MSWAPSSKARTRVADYPDAFDRIVESRDGDTRTAWCAAGLNTAVWQHAVFSCYGLFPSNVVSEGVKP